MAPDLMSAGSPDDLAARLATSFRDLHGRDPVGVFAAPGRVNLIGEHVDYNGGRVLPLALAHATYAAVAPRDDDTVTVASRQQDAPWAGRLDALGPGQVEGWPTYVAGVVWALRQDGWSLPGLDLVVDSTVPVGAGLSSSAALECSVALALCAVVGVDPDDEVRRTLVAACVRAEAEVAGANTGGMDQAVSLLARGGHALLLDTRDGSTGHVPWRPEEHGLELLVIDTRAEHALADGGYGNRRADCEEAARTLGVETLREVTDPDEALGRLEGRVRRRARHVLTEMTRVGDAVEALEADDLPALGRALDGSHDSLRDDFEVSCAELDAVVGVCRDRGALGARMTGGGFGGSAIALLRADEVTSTAEAVADEFDRRGWATPAVLHAPASPGARRLR